jgi:hypothetical protein
MPDMRGLIPLAVEVQVTLGRELLIHREPARTR